MPCRSSARPAAGRPCPGRRPRRRPGRSRRRRAGARPGGRCSASGPAAIACRSALGEDLQARVVAGPWNWPTAQASVAVRAETALRVVADGLTLGTTVQVGVAAMAGPASKASEAPAASAAGMSRCRMLVPSWLRERLGPAPDRRKHGCNGTDLALKRTARPGALAPPILAIRSRTRPITPPYASIGARGAGLVAALARRYRAIQIRAGHHSLTAEEDRWFHLRAAGRRGSG